MKTKHVLSILLVALAAIGATIQTVAAEAIGDTYGIGGFGLGWLIVGAVIIIAVVALLFQVSKKVIKPFVPWLVIFFIVGLALQYNIPEEVGEITPSITWSVSATVDEGNVTIDDDARTIMVLYYENNSASIINQTDSTAWVAPVLNFTIGPTQITGLVDTTLGATANCVVNNPDKTFTEDSSTYDLFADASGENKKDLVWTADDTDEYESHYCTVQFGSTETVLLTVTLLDDGLSICEAGDYEAVTLSIGGITYTMTVMCSGSAAA